MDKVRNDLILCRCNAARGPYFSVLPFDGLARGLFGLLFTTILASASAMAQQDRPLLRLLVFNADPGSVHTTRSVGVDDTLVPALSAHDARAMTYGFLGRPIDDDLLIEIRDKLATYYSALGRPFVGIAIPAQDVGNGMLRVTIIETRLRRIIVEGNRWFDASQYRDAVRTLPGSAIDIRGLEADAEWLNHNDHRHATMSLRPTDDPGLFDVGITAKDRFPVELTLAADNTGTRETGLYRTSVGLNWTNALWRGDDLNYSFVAGPDGFRLLQHAVSYTAYLPWRDAMSFAGVTADTRGSTPESQYAISVNGHADVLLWRYGLALPSSPDFVQRIDFGYDFKSTNTNILSGGELVFPATSELNQFSVSYIARRADPLGLTGLTTTLVGSSGQLTRRNTTAALPEQQPGASPSYVYARVTLERLTALPHDAVWSARVTAQFSSDNLLPSEQLALGGAQSIRGFEELAATRDNAMVMEHELRFPPVRSGFLLDLSDIGTLVPSVFVDAGAGRNHLNLAGVRRSWVEMLSIGAGLTWQFIPSAGLRLSWGVPLIRNGHIGASLALQFGTVITF